MKRGHRLDNTMLRRLLLITGLLLNRSARCFAEFCTCRNGSIITTWAILLPVIVGALGLGLETGNWYLVKRNLQAAADAAAIAGAYESTTSARQSAATATLATNGFGSGSNITATVNNPPQSGSYTSSADAVEVILSQPQNLLFSSLFLSSKPTITVRAVAQPKTSPPALGSGCIVSLDPTGSSDFDMTGGATINATSCFIASNSNNNAAIKIIGGATMNVQGLYTMGAYTVGGGANLNSTDAPVVNATSPVADPYQGVSPPSYSGCNYTSYAVQSNTTLSPGVYCNGLSLNAGANVTLSPGVYVIDRGAFTVNGGATLSGSGVTIILTSSTGSSYATATINGGANVTLSAPTTGDYAGMAFFQDRNATLNNSDKFNGGATMNITGAVYFPSADLTFNGGSSVNVPCMQIIGWDLNFSGGTQTYVNGNCQGSGMTPITTPVSGTVTLVE